jgi:penicillin-binding protein 1C
MAIRAIKLRAVVISSVVFVLLVLLLDRLLPPPLDQVQLGRQSQVVLAADGTPLRAFADRRGIWRYPIARTEVSSVYLQTLLNYEDRWFYRHPGVNPAALIRALGQSIWHRRLISGGSTITMQVARMIEPIPHTGAGKIKQMLRALQIEARLSKAEILELYLRYAPFGGPLEGVEAAAYGYLGKSSAQLSDAEAALLVVLPQRPSRLRPDRSPLRAQIARNKVLMRMVELKVWPAERAHEAMRETVFARRLRSPVLAPLLAQKLIREAPDASRVQSTLNAQWQRMSEQRVQSYMKRFPNSSSAAVLIVENASMQARAYVGSANFADAKSFGHIDMVQALRSPGSTLKPTLYGMALDAGLIHSESLFIDAPQSFSGYRPANFSENFNGPISAASALRLSLNVPAVDLLDRVGPGKFYAALGNAGVNLQMPEGAKPNLSLILGGAGSNLAELVSMHAALARGGMAAKLRLRSTDPLVERRLLSPGAAWIVFQMLADAPRPGVTNDALFNASGRSRIAFKTGTSFGFRDAWALGSNGKVSVGVWIGRPDGTPSPGSFGAVSALPLLFALFDSLPTAARGGAPAKPANVEKVDICWPLGTRAEGLDPQLCHKRREAWVLDGAVPPSFPEREARIWQAGTVQYFADARSGARRNLSCMKADADVRQIARWPALAYPWLSLETRNNASLPPLARECSPDVAQIFPLVIEGINDQSVLKTPPNRDSVAIGVRALGSNSEIRWLLDNALIGASASGLQ